MITVNAERPYPCLIGRGVAEQITDYITGSKVFLMASADLESQADQLAERLASRADVTIYLVPAGERCKATDVLDDSWRTLARQGFTRSDQVIGFGGGTTTDLAGFVAATYLRGIGYVGVPTTVLAMVDASVGGKTGIDLREGKNLVGAFYEPSAVLIDLDYLDTLPTDEVTAGMAEIIKAGFVREQGILDLIVGQEEAARDVSGPIMEQLISAAVAFKADVVSHDFRESTSHGTQIGRELLNYGHTMGHAIETYEHFHIRHGHAVSLGMMYAAYLSREILGLGDEVVDLHRRTLRAFGLPTFYQGADYREIRDLLSRDKKARGAHLRFIGLRDLHAPEVIVDPDEAILERCFQLLAEE